MKVDEEKYFAIINRLFESKVFHNQNTKKIEIRGIAQEGEKYVRIIYGDISNFIKSYKVPIINNLEIYEPFFISQNHITNKVLLR